MGEEAAARPAITEGNEAGLVTEFAIGLVGNRELRDKTGSNGWVTGLSEVAAAAR